MVDIPELPVDDIRRTADLARLLMGDDRSSSAFGVFVDRCFMFNCQPLNLSEKTYWGMFYERLRRPTEVMMALGAGIAVDYQQVPINHGLQVKLDIKMFPSFYGAPEGEVPMPEEDEECVGNHSVTLIGLDSQKERLRFHHLFSPDWGKDGGGSLPLDYLFDLTRGATAFRWHGGPAPPGRDDESESEHKDAPADEGLPDDHPVDHPETNKARLKFLVERYSDGKQESKWMLCHVDDEVVWLGRKLIGASDGDVWLQSALLLRGVAEDPLLVAWMSARVVSDDLIDVEEFFVWPTYRGRGFGAALAGRTLLAAYAEGRRVRWLELEADSIVNARVGNRAPTWASDFKWVPPDENVGWGVARMTEEIYLMPLLERLGNIHAPGGVHLLWTDGMVSVADHPKSPNYALCLARDAPPPQPSKSSQLSR